MTDFDPRSDAETADLQARLLDAMLLNVPFDGWSETAFREAAQAAGVDLPLARVICPRGAVDLAVAYHRRGDAAMRAALGAEDLSGLRFRDRIARAVELRLTAADREAVRRGSALFALPQHAATGAKLVWETADAIWDALGDSSDDINWYSKRATLSAVYGATVLYWLGDESEGGAATRAFLDRRIGDVMGIESAKARVKDSRVLSTLFAAPIWLAGRVRAPGARGASAGGGANAEGQGRA
ncbi:COQ9 family protein [Frigidibacter sp. MR17.24]|uniref:COQ9 family protein n=1 Tax=Frigidibacter sp. MR17.24 TaxID=3127345 RepID=UPI003012DBA4